MKKINTLRVLKAMLLSSIFVVGCGKKDDNQVPPVVTVATYPPDSPPGQGTDSTGASWDYGATVSLNVATGVDAYGANNYPELSNLLRSHTTNNYPLDIQMNVNLSDDGEGRNYGHVQIRFFDNDQWNTMYFLAENTQNSSESNLMDKGVHQSEYNRWATLDGKQIFSGYFQGGIRSSSGSWFEWMSSVVLVVNNVKDQGDGQGAQYVDGEIWYRNLKDFNPNPKQLYYSYGWWEYIDFNQQDQGPPVRKCWFIYTGTFACRSNAVMNKTSVNLTNDGYRKLGTFKDLPKFQAFNQGN